MELNAIIAAVIGLLIFLIVIYYFFWWPPPFTRARHSLGEARVLERGGMRFQYFVGGSANGPTVILIPSAGREASDFNELVSELHRDGMRTISINPPGIGLSDIPSRSVNLYDLAEFIFRVVFKETLSEGEVFVIGHAFGNRVARAFAHLYPGKTRALILISPGSADHSRPMVKRMLHLIYTLRSPSRLRSRRIRTLFFAPGNQVPKYWTVGWHGFTALLQGQAIAATPDKIWTGGGGRPILALQGLQDKITTPKRAGRALRNDLGSRVKLVEINDSGHALLPEKPDMVAYEVQHFIAQSLQSRNRADLS